MVAVIQGIVSLPACSYGSWQHSQLVAQCLAGWPVGPVDNLRQNWKRGRGCHVDPAYIWCQERVLWKWSCLVWYWAHWVLIVLWNMGPATHAWCAWWHESDPQPQPIVITGMLHCARLSFPDQTFETFHQMLFTIFLNSSISTFYHFYLIFLKSLKEKNICQCLVVMLCILCLRNCYCFVTCLLLKKTQSQLPFTPRAGIVRQGEDK